MKISGLQKLTLLDYPGNVACTVFTRGCNFRCPFCQNSSLVLPDAQTDIFSTEEILEFLRKRIGLLDGVAISGGEPLLYPEITAFLRSVKEMGYRVKLDTNGSNPLLLGEVIRAGLVDMIAMDIKASPEKYPLATGMKTPPLSEIENSIRILMGGSLPFEFRTTVVRGIHDEKDLLSLAKWIRGNEEYYLQQFVDSGSLISSDGLSAFSKKEMYDFADLIRAYVPHVKIRGI